GRAGRRPPASPSPGPSVPSCRHRRSPPRSTRRRAVRPVCPVASPCTPGRTELEVAGAVGLELDERLDLLVEVVLVPLRHGDDVPQALEGGFLLRLGFCHLATPLRRTKQPHNRLRRWPAGSASRRFNPFQAG